MHDSAISIISRESKWARWDSGPSHFWMITNRPGVVTEAVRSMLRLAGLLAAEHHVLRQDPEELLGVRRLEPHRDQRDLGVIHGRKLPRHRTRDGRRTPIPTGALRSPETCRYS